MPKLGDFVLIAVPAAVLASSGSVKLVDPQRAILSTKSLAVLPVGWESAFVLGLALAETLTGILLVFPVSRIWAVFAGMVLFALFAGNNLWAAIFDSATACGCFGPYFQIPPTYMLGFDLSLLAMLALLSADPSTPTNLLRVLRR